MNDAADPNVRKRLAAASKVLTAAKDLVARAPAAPKARAPQLTCADALLAVLPPDRYVSPAEPVYRPAELALKEIIRHQITESDITALLMILRDRKDHEIARRFMRFGEARRHGILELLKRSDIKLHARAREAAAQQRAVRDSATAPGPTNTSDDALVLDDSEPADPAAAPTAGAATPTAAGVTVSAPTSIPDDAPVLDDTKPTDPAAAPSEPDPPDVITRKGGPLPYRQEMERSFDRSFANIEAHTGMAAELEPLGAQAITVGHVVTFADAQPSPALVAHEATHAVQNEQAGASTAMASGGIMSEHSPAEAEADAMADRVAQHGAGVRLPPVVQAPASRIARAIRPRNAPPPPPPLYSASEWIDRMLFASPLRIDVINHLAAAKLSTGHPRFTWSPANSLPLRVWGTVGNAARLQLVLAPFDILARIDQVRALDDAKGKVNVGPLTSMPVG